MITSGITLDKEFTRQRIDTKVVAHLSVLVRHHLQLAKDRANRLYWYNQGVYEDTGEDAVREMYQRILDERMDLDRWRASLARDLVTYIQANVPFVIEKPEVGKINLRNGLFDWDSGMLLAHTPDYLATVRIPIEYNPDAECPTWDNFLEEVLPVNGGPNFLVEVIAWCMVPLTSFQKSIILVGSGSNGKSTYLNGLIAAVGEDNCCHVPLQNLGNPTMRFAMARLLGKLVNVVGDLPAKKIENTSTIKELTGEDTLEAEFKGRNGFRFKSFARLIFACNEVVKSEDDTEGYKRRFIHVPFTKKFAVDPKRGMELSEGLSSPKELSGLFNRIASVLPQLAEEGFTITPEIATIIDNWVPMEPVTEEWFKRVIVVDPNGKIPTAAFYSFWNQLCPFDGLRNRGKVVTFMKMLFPFIHTGAVCKIDGRSVRCYTGIRMRDDLTQRSLEAMRASDVEE